MDHTRESELGYFNGKGFDLAGPHRDNAIMHRSQRKTTNSVKQTAHRQWSHLDTAYMIIIAVWALTWTV